MRYGALAPPVGLGVASPPPLEFVSLEAFSFSPAEVPPAEELLEPPGLEDSPPVSLFAASPPDDSVEVPSPELPVDVLDVVEVEVVWAAAFSAEVFTGGVISGVLL